MSLYVRQLEEHAKALRDGQATETKAAEVSDVEAARERLTPLADRLTNLLITIPLSVQREGISLLAIQAMLKGRWRGTCHPGELGTALRRRGWVRKRGWREGEDGFRARWHPPGSA